MATTSRSLDNEDSHAQGLVRHLAGPARIESRLALIEGVILRIRDVGRHGLVAYCCPWWRCSSREVQDVPLRIRLMGDRRTHSSLEEGSAIRIACEDLEGPRRGAWYWVATATPVRYPEPGAGSSIAVPPYVRDRVLGPARFDCRANRFVAKRKTWQHGGLHYTVLIERPLGAAGGTRNDIELVRRARHFVMAFERSWEAVRNAMSAWLGEPIVDGVACSRGEGIPDLGAATFLPVALFFAPDGYAVVHVAIGRVVSERLEITLADDTSILLIRYTAV